ncbi:hypothetical protein K0T92_03335 [Paenibacillus oenotherae]|uniref:Uncharacterized protein n=1 Tax=Paenibacillus oenotherae TaxID=1435645 RepID=A0ABS7D1F9_9BACL|nr:hypothetical protein [Paenibacillus oenotherae]MBW7473777.1 hypothetical protein [Paenibacillus oenotherae]
MPKYSFTILLRVGLVLVFALAALPIQHADASFIDRITDIYNAPEKVEELTESFKLQQEKLERELNEQQERLLEAQQTAQQYAAQQEELMKQNEQYRLQNEQLSKQNNSLLQRMETMEADKSKRSQFYRKIVTSVLVIAGMGLLYLLSIRIWRYNVWRKHKHSGGGV